jgi:serine/threonine-protein kinase
VDIYSLGATLFHLVTGSDPQDNPLLIFDFTKNPRPRQINPALSTEMERLLIRAVEYKPEHRFQSGAELRDALNSHLEKLRSGQVSYGLPAVELGGDTVAVAIVFCGFCGAASRLMTSFARTADRSSPGGADSSAQAGPSHCQTCRGRHG